MHNKSASDLRHAIEYTHTDKQVFCPTTPLGGAPVGLPHLIFVNYKERDEE